MSRAFDAKRANEWNITVGVSFGETRELAFRRTVVRSKDSKNESQDSPPPCELHFPQPNNTVFTFGRDVNIRWMHGINAATPDELQQQHDDRQHQQQQENSTVPAPSPSPVTSGRISIIVWGWAETVVEEPGSPSLLTST